MKPNEKAKELFSKFKGMRDDCSCLEYMCICSHIGHKMAKQVSLICVDEILQEFENVMTPNPFKIYWNEVKKEIKRM
jgi:hypothetical protein